MERGKLKQTGKKRVAVTRYFYNSQAKGIGGLWPRCSETGTSALGSKQDHLQGEGWTRGVVSWREGQKPL